ncbi:MAG: sugar phosphate isomerase/epimerase [Oscillospiraceae bacterium]|nr:sugar phosphate isomerase/epimerase [Oscillospiraceae bacterium]
MSRFLIIPQIDALDESLKLAEQYGFGFEYNDFFLPDVMDDKRLTDEIIARYKGHELPEYCTMHGAFFDVLIFSDDRKIREISEQRVRMSLDTARKIGVRGVVFHTNHNPSLTADFYVNHWLERNEKFWRSIACEYPDLEIYIENMFDSSPHLLRELASRLSDMKNFGVCLDYAHAVIFGTDIDGWVEALAPYVKHMHINDNDLKNDLHLAVGDGKIDWKHFKKSFDERLSAARSVLIETSLIEKQRSSAEFLSKMGIL